MGQNADFVLPNRVIAKKIPVILYNFFVLPDCQNCGICVIILVTVYCCFSGSRTELN